MKITPEHPDANKIAQVLVDGKPVVNAIELDTDEGWVVVALPDLPKHLSTVAKDGTVTEEDTECDWKTKKLFGEVEVKFHKE